MERIHGRGEFRSTDRIWKAGRGKDRMKAETEGRMEKWRSASEEI